MTNKMIGRDAVAMLKEMFGIEQTAIREIRVRAAYNSAVEIEVDTFGKTGVEVESTDATTSDDAADGVQRYIVEVRRA